MKRKFVYAFLMFFLIGIISSLNVSAHMPPVHLYIFDSSTAQPINSDLYRVCVKYPDLCFSGNQLIDFGVYWYYTNGGVRYSTTHSPAFCKALLENAPSIPNPTGDPEWAEKQMACAVGGCTHGPADLTSHGDGGLVQYSISHSFLVNSVIHVFAEQHESNIIENRDIGIFGREYEFLNSSKTCQDLFTTTMLGTDAYKSISKADLDLMYEDYVSEILSSQATSYNPAFKEKSFLGTLGSLPKLTIAIYIVVLSLFFVISVILLLRIFKKQAKIRHYIGIVIFLGLFVLMLWLMISAIQGSAFKSFISFIRPISNLVPVGNVDTYISGAIQNTKNFFIQGETAFEGQDFSGLATNPVLPNADKQVMFMDYIILGVIVVFFLWFIWYLLKKNKAINGGFSL